ncbi:hypothetical protein CONPUDRAFT_78481 [Coniophora puteana RWD-64-598 SS2]|uniref:Uncharacterized protein n=1 Tax=Coniophora puteana (strain RWD-64-598) TaxID=741705 RepID=R7SCC1_CONPW|nr:uncharacterized protein CONPUDRAFT_78481 [Coniophora puteana RWD-64-598 SS2]EIW73821.1 hypothetical protein CONPUDRAFT_78481 [Coniophora puteana RWD-64-598 SS2]
MHQAKEVHIQWMNVLNMMYSGRCIFGNWPLLNVLPGDFSPNLLTYAEMRAVVCPWMLYIMRDAYDVPSYTGNEPEIIKMDDMTVEQAEKIMVKITPMSEAINAHDETAFTVSLVQDVDENTLRFVTTSSKFIREVQANCDDEVMIQFAGDYWMSEKDKMAECRVKLEEREKARLKASREKRAANKGKETARGVRKTLKKLDALGINSSASSSNSSPPEHAVSKAAAQSDAHKHATPAPPSRQEAPIVVDDSPPSPPPPSQPGVPPDQSRREVIELDSSDGQLRPSKRHDSNGSSPSEERDQQGRGRSRSLSAPESHPRQHSGKTDPRPRIGVTPGLESIDDHVQRIVIVPDLGIIAVLHQGLPHLVTQVILTSTIMVLRVRRAMHPITMRHQTIVLLLACLLLHARTTLLVLLAITVMILRQRHQEGILLLGALLPHGPTTPLVLLASMMSLSNPHTILPAFSVSFSATYPASFSFARTMHDPLNVLSTPAVPLSRLSAYSVINWNVINGVNLNSEF